MSQWLQSVQCWRGTSFIRSRSIFSGSVWRVRRSRCESRTTCVSTTMPSSFPKGCPGPRSRFSGPRPAAPAVRPSFPARGLCISRRAPPPPRDALGFVPEEAGGTNCILHLVLLSVCVSCGAAVFREKRRSDKIDPLVRALGGENCRDQQLQGIAKIQFAARAWINLGQNLDELLNSFLGFHASVYDRREEKASLRYSLPECATT